jgi:hypothetical protein
MPRCPQEAHRNLKRKELECQRPSSLSHFQQMLMLELSSVFLYCRQLSHPATPSSVTDLGSYLSLHPGLQTEIQKAKEACVGQRTKVPSQTLRVLLREEIDW